MQAHLILADSSLQLSGEFPELPGGKAGNRRRANQHNTSTGSDEERAQRSRGSFNKEASHQAPAPAHLPHTNAPRPELFTELAHGNAQARLRPHTASCRSCFRVSLGDGAGRHIFEISEYQDFPTRQPRLFTSLGGGADGPFFQLLSSKRWKKGLDAKINDLPDPSASPLHLPGGRG